MVVIGQPDLAEAKDRTSWRNHLRFLEAMMFLPLVAYYLTHVGEEPQAGSWFLGTLFIATLLFVPAELRLAPLPHKKLPPLKASEIDKTHIAQKLKSHTRVLFGNFALGVLMGIAILFPFALSLLLVSAGFRLGLYQESTKTILLQISPAISCFCVPGLMPLFFLALGPFVLRLTQGGRDLLKQDKWQSRIIKLEDRAAKLGKPCSQYWRKLILWELPWSGLGIMNAFFLGWPSRWSPTSSTIFFIENLDSVLSEDEIDFVLYHEAAHGLSKHPIHRTLLGLGVFAFFVFSEGAAFALRAPSLSFAFAVVSLVWGYFLLKKQSEMHELEADVLAINLQGGTIEALNHALSAIKKLDTFSGKAEQAEGHWRARDVLSTHPQTTQRLAYLESMFAHLKSPAGNDNTEIKRAA